jgi:hypothetical protein
MEVEMSRKKRHASRPGESRSNLVSLLGRLDGHFGRCAALAAAGVGGGMIAAPQNADASIIYSGVISLPIQPTINGLYLNLATYPAPGSINEPGNTGGSTVPGWDINPYIGTGQPVFYGAAPNYNFVPDASISTKVAALSFGALIDITTATGTGQTGNNGSLFPTSGPGAYYGFRFRNEALGNQVENGWARVTVPSTGTPGTLFEYAYENTGASITAGAVPEPGSISLLALGAVGLLARRRRMNTAA